VDPVRDPGRDLGLDLRDGLPAQARWLDGPTVRDLARVAVLGTGATLGPYATAWQLVRGGVAFPVGYWPWPIELGAGAWYALMALGWILCLAASRF
jgi:hypothetical protein